MSNTGLLVQESRETADNPVQESESLTSPSIKELERQVEDQFNQLGLNGEPEDLDNDDPEYQKAYLDVASRIADKKVADLRLKNSRQIEEDIKKEKEHSLVAKIDKARQTVINKFSSLAKKYFGINPESEGLISDKEIQVLADMLMKKHWSFWTWRTVRILAVLFLNPALAVASLISLGILGVGGYWVLISIIQGILGGFIYIPKILKPSENGWLDFYRSLTFLRKNLGKHYFPTQEFRHKVSLQHSVKKTA